MFKYGDYVKLNDSFWNGAVGRITNWESTWEPHPKEDRELIKYEIELDGNRVWCSETTLEPAISELPASGAI